MVTILAEETDVATITTFPFITHLRSTATMHVLHRARGQPAKQGVQQVGGNDQLLDVRQVRGSFASGEREQEVTRHTGVCRQRRPFVLGG